MNPGPIRRRPSRRRVVLIFGEDENDTKFLAEMIGALCPDLVHAVKPLRRPPILLKDASPDAVPDRVETIAALIEAERSTSDVICVFAHEDCDAVEPAHKHLTNKIEEAFRVRGYEVRAVTPAWELESWILQFPLAVATYRPSWRSLQRFTGRNVGVITNAKEELRRALRPSGRRPATRDYRESDAPEIAKIIRDKGIARQPQASSASYQAFVGKVDECCRAAS